MGTLRKIGRKIDDYILQPLKENPIGAIVSVGGMALGIPPVYAGALGGAAGAAATGNNILEGALLGGATGYVGGAAGSAAAKLGAGNILAGAAGGAAAGATGALLTGQDIVKGALTGGALGGLSGAAYEYILKPDGSLAPVEDRSTYSSEAIAEQNKLGNTVKINNPDGGSTLYTPDGAITTVSPSGEIWSQDLDGNVTIKYTDGSIFKQNLDGSVTPGTGWDLSQVGTTPTTGITGPIVGGNQPGAPAGTVPVPVTPVFPTITQPTTPTTPDSGDGGGTGNYDFVRSEIQRGVGLNPGFIAPTPFYQTNDPAQSQFFWGSRGFQTGPGFNAAQYNQAAAPASPWGAQSVAKPLTPEEFALAAQGRYTAPAAVTPATRVQPYNPAANIQPTQPNQISGQIYLVPINYGGSSTTGSPAPAPAPATAPTVTIPARPTTTPFVAGPTTTPTTPVVGPTTAPAAVTTPAPVVLVNTPMVSPAGAPTGFNNLVLADSLDMSNNYRIPFVGPVSPDGAMFMEP